MTILIFKICPKCLVIKPSGSFGKDKSTKSGLRSWCKDCVAEYRRSPKGKEAERRYRQGSACQQSQKRHAKTVKGRVTSCRATAKYRAANPEKIAIWNAVRAAKLAGKLIPEFCAKCGSGDNTHGHHPDYRKPLEVIWLCARCHKSVHKEAA